MTDDNEENETSFLAQSMEEERAHEKKWMWLGAFAGVLIFLFSFRACDSNDFVTCVKHHDNPAECRGAGWP